MLQKLACLIGRHKWDRRVNREVGGSGSVYYVCAHCNKEKAGYDKPGEGQQVGLSGGGA
jgi:hypothetical protein